MSLTLRKLATAAALALAAAVPLSSSAAVLTFDDISSAAYGNVPNGYGGLNWNSFGFLDVSEDAYEGSGFRNGLVSGNYVAYNIDGSVAHALAVSSGTTFDFNSVFLTSAGNNGLNIDVNGYRNGVLLYQKTVVVSGQAPTSFKFDYLGIDDLRFTAHGGTPPGSNDGVNPTQFALDNFAFNETTTDVPEPATLGLMGLGLAGFAAARRKPKQAK